MKYIDLSKLPTSPYSAITNVVALDSNGDIIKAENINIENELTDYPTKEEVNATLEDYATIERMENDFQVFGEFIDMAMPTPQPTGTTATADSKQYVYCGDGLTSVFNDFRIEQQPTVVNFYKKNWGDNTNHLTQLYSASSSRAGVMTSEMYNKLMNLNSGDTATKVVWGESSNINSYTTAGVYDITGERRNANDNLPMLNSNPGHTIAARLYVLDSSISGNGANDDKCLTQVLMLSNRVGGDGNLYVRTGRGSSISNISWEQWGTLQQNINVGTITSYDNLIDNGIYSGVYTNGSTIFDTFVMVVINNYAVAGQVGADRTVSQFLYVTHIDGSVEFLRRASFKYNNGALGWYKWKGLFNNSQYISNLQTAPNMDNITKQVLRFSNTDFSVPSGTLNNLFYNHIKNLLNSNNYKQIEVFAETTSFNVYNSGGGYSSKIYAEIHCYTTDNLYKKYQKIVVGYVIGSNLNQGLLIIQDIDFS